MTTTTPDTTTQPARRGRPPTGPRRQVRIDDETLAVFAAIGGGNVSRGMRDGAKMLQAAGLVRAATREK